MAGAVVTALWAKKSCVNWAGPKILLKKADQLKNLCRCYPKRISEVSTPWSSSRGLARVSGLIPGAGNLKKLFIWTKIYELTQKQTVTEFVC